MKLTKENIYINLQGKSEEELTELYDFLNSIGEKLFRDDIEDFLNYSEENNSLLSTDKNDWCCAYKVSNKTEVTIQQLKEILQPMEKFKPIAMKCTQEQFEAIKPKLNNQKSLDIFMIDKKWNNFYLVLFEDGKITNGLVSDISNREIHEEWNEEVFLKACGIEVEPTLEQQLEKAEAEVKRLKEAIEDSKPKVGDWVFVKDVNMYYKKSIEYASYRDEVKITDQELINKLNELIK